jgi:hypothetical protein
VASSEIRYFTSSKHLQTGNEKNGPVVGKGSGNTVDCVLLDIAPRETVILDSGTILEIEHKTAVRLGHGNDDPDDILL